MTLAIAGSRTGSLTHTSENLQRQGNWATPLAAETVVAPRIDAVAIPHGQHDALVRAAERLAVFGIPDPRWGETPCAVVVPKPGTRVAEAEVTQLCIDQLGSYKKPGRVVNRDEPLPKTPVGKIKCGDLCEPYWAGHTRRVAGS
jgi:acyl-CoA synthetase (AMP-forming)/AMP-acid ligase II